MHHDVDNLSDNNARTTSANVAPPPPAAAATPSADHRIAVSSLQRNDQPSESQLALSHLPREML